jgi:hypothetical protein
MRNITPQAFVSGHLDLTEEEFNEHYVSKIKQCIENNGLIYVGDARGADVMTQQYVAACMRTSQLRIFHMFISPRNTVEGAITFGGFESDSERDKSLTSHTNFDIAWVRPGREKSGTMRNIQRRAEVEQQK